MSRSFLTPAEYRAVLARSVEARLADRKRERRAELLLTASDASERATASFLASL